MSNYKLVLKDNWEKLNRENKNLENTLYSKLLLDISAPCIFYVALDTVNNLKMLIIETDPNTLLPKHIYPDILGLEIYPLYSNGKTKIFLKVIDSKFNDLFESLCVDLITEVSSTNNKNKCIDHFFYKLHIWKDFFKNMKIKSLTDNSAQGLFGELYFINNICSRNISIEKAILSWEGPNGSEHDFKFENGAIEVKTSKPRSSDITISNIDQLDNEKCNNLFLVHFMIERIQMEESNKLNLPKLIKKIREKIKDTPESILFDKKLISSGYIDNQFDDLYFNVTDSFYYEVKNDFPRLTSLNIPKSIKNVKYIIDISTCKDYIVKEKTMFETTQKDTHVQ